MIRNKIGYKLPWKHSCLFSFHGLSIFCHSRTFVWTFLHCTGMVFSHKYIYICERMYLDEGCILNIYLFSRFQDTIVSSSRPCLKSSFLYFWIRSVFWWISCIIPYWCWNFFHSSSFVVWMLFWWVLFVEVCYKESNINTLLYLTLFISREREKKCSLYLHVSV
jgi:hypothetical protein